MGLYAGKAGRQWCLGIACLVGVLLAAAPAFAQFDRGQISGVDQRSNRRRDARRHGDRDASRHADGASRPSPTRAASTRSPTCLPAGTTSAPSSRDSRRSVQEGVQLDAAGALTIDFALETGALTEKVTVTAGATLLQTDVGAAQDRRVEGHRAAVVLGPQPDRRGRPEARRHRRQLQQLQLLRPRQRRLQHQRQPQRREQHHRRRRDGDPHPVVGRDRRHPERRRDPGSPGADRRLHAGVRARQRRPDPHGHQERQQPLQRQRLVLLRDDKLQANTWARNRSPNALENSGAAPFDYKQYGYSLGGPVPVGSVQGQAVLLRRAGVGELLRGADATLPTVPTAKMRAGDFSELLDPNNGFFTGARRSSTIR